MFEEKATTRARTSARTNATSRSRWYELIVKRNPDGIDVQYKVWRNSSLNVVEL